MQSALQQTPSTQLPLAQSRLALQLAPGSPIGGTHELLSQRPAEQSPSTAQGAKVL
jgi:hypothetical protein